MGSRASRVSKKNYFTAENVLKKIPRLPTNSANFDGDPTEYLLTSDVYLEKKIFYMLVNSFTKVDHKTASKPNKWDHSNGTVLGPILEKYWTGNAAI